ncbi:hypothetical protein [Pararhizobium gei]|uniref:hypothetical protein n=1 Tax=Pararhizobium gei TaxID=1395951 RepID=UPI0023DB8197|nr:hypothetical protein [Rhizobium gei]
MIGRFIAFPCLGGAVLLASGFSTRANDVHIGPVSAYVEINVKPWVDSPLIVQSLRDSNRRHAGLGPPDIEKLEAQWNLELSSSVQPLIHSIVDTALSAFLRKKQVAAEGAITEILVIDAKGLAIGESDIATDLFQGDELKWQKTYLAGPGAVFIDKAQKDQSTQTLQSQASITISDPQTGKAIGAITVGINLDAL